MKQKQHEYKRKQRLKYYLECCCTNRGNNASSLESIATSCGLPNVEHKQGKDNASKQDELLV